MTHFHDLFLSQLQVKMTLNVRVTKRPLSVKDIVSFPHVLQRGGWSCREGKSAAMTLLIRCFCVVKRGHGFTGKQRKVRPEWQAGSTLIQGQGQTHHSDTGHILIHLVSAVHLLISIYGSSHSPLV